MSSPITPAPAPAASIEKSEKALPNVLDDINEKIIDVRQKACARKSLVLDSKFVQKAKLQAKRLVDRGKSSSSSPPIVDSKDSSDNKSEDATAPIEPSVSHSEAVIPASAAVPESLHVSFQTPLAEQFQNYEQLISINIDAIFKLNQETTRLQVQEELAKWSKLIYDEAKLSV